LEGPSGIEPALFKVFEEGQLNTAIRERSGILQLQDRLKEWLAEEG
jgi:hypothetical protein